MVPSSKDHESYVVAKKRFREEYLRKYSFDQFDLRAHSRQALASWHATWETCVASTCIGQSSTHVGALRHVNGDGSCLPRQAQLKCLPSMLRTIGDAGPSLCRKAAHTQPRSTARTAACVTPTMLHTSRRHVLFWAQVCSTYCNLCQQYSAAA